MLIVGLDPGSVRLGWGIVEVQPRHRGDPRYVAAGVLKAPPDWPRWRRLEHLGSQLDAILAGQGVEAGLDAAAIEAGYVPAGRTKGALELGEARGVASYVAARRGLGVLFVAPSSVKLAVTGSGSADKDQVARIVAARLRLVPPLAHDLADALGVALAASPVLAREGIHATAA